MGKINKKQYFFYDETMFIFNKIFIKEWSEAITNNINTIPKNKWVLVTVK